MIPSDSTYDNGAPALDGDDVVYGQDDRGRDVPRRLLDVLVQGRHQPLDGGHAVLASVA